MKKVKQHDSIMSIRQKNVCMVLNYIEQTLNLVSTIIYVSISVFALLDGIPIGIASSAVRLKNCVITAGIKM